jgi:hypothetical protein
MSSPFFGFPRKPLPGQREQIPTSPPINPDAPLPTVPQGPAPAPMQIPQAPPSPQQGMAPMGDLSDMSGIGKIGVVLSDVAAGLQGRSDLPSQQLMQQRRQLYEAKRQQFIQSLGILEQFGSKLDSVPLSKRTAASAEYRKRFIELAGGDPSAGDLYDTAIPSDGSYKSMIDALKNDEIGKYALATDQPIKSLMEIYNDPKYRERMLQHADAEAVPQVSARIQKLLADKDPKVQALIKKLQKGPDGTVQPLTKEDIKLVSQAAMEGPNGTRLSADDMALMDRNEQAIVNGVGGTMRTTVSAEKKRELDDEEAMRMRVLEKEYELKAKNTPAKTPINYGAKARDDAFARKVYEPFVTNGEFAEAQDGLKTLQGVMNELGTRDEKGVFHKNSNAVSGRFAGLAPDVARSAQALDIEDRVRSVVQKTYRLIYGAQFTEKEGERAMASAYNPKLDEEVNYKRLENYLQKAAKQYAMKKSAAAYFEANNGSLEGFPGLKILQDMEAEHRSEAGVGGGAEDQGDVRTYKLKDGSTVRGRLRPDGKLEIVQ